MTPQEFVEKYKVTGRVIDGPNIRTNRGWEHFAFRLHLNHRPLSGGTIGVFVPWKMGVGLDVAAFTGDDETMPAESVAQVVESLARELPVRNMSYPEFAEVFDAWNEDGYRSWEACRELAGEVYRWCDDLEILVDLETLEDN